MTIKSVGFRLQTDGKGEVVNDFNSVKVAGEDAMTGIAEAAERTADVAASAADRAATRQVEAWKRQAAAAKVAASGAGANGAFDDALAERGNSGQFATVNLDRTTGAAREAAAAFQAQFDAEEQAAAGAAKLRAALNPLLAAQQLYDRELAQARTLISQNVISLDEYSRRLSQLRGGLEAARLAQERETDATGHASNAKAILQHSIRSSIDSFSAGLPVTMIFAEQLGRLSEAAGLAGGTLGKFGAFMGGPWGLAVSTAIALAVTLGSKFLFAGEAADKETASVFNLAKASEDLAQAQGKANQTAEQGVRAAVAYAAYLYKQADAARAATIAELGLAKARLQRADAEPGGEGGINFGVAAGGSIERNIVDLDKQIAVQTKLIQSNRTAFDTAKASRLEFFAAGDASKSTAEVNRHSAAVAKLRSEYLAGKLNDDQYRNAIANEDRAHEAASKSAGHHAKGLSDVEQAARAAAKAEAAFWAAIKDPGQISFELAKVNYAQEAKKAADAAKTFYADYGINTNELHDAVAASDAEKDIAFKKNQVIADDLAAKTRSRISSVADFYRSAFTGAGGSIGQALKNALLDAITTSLAKFTVSKLGGLFDGAGGILGKLGLSFGHNATGTAAWSGGMTWVNENGPEIADLPNGTRIYPAAETRRMLQAGNDNAGGRGGHTVIVNANGAVLAETVRGWVAEGIAIASTQGAAGGAALSASEGAAAGARTLGRRW